MSSSYKVTSGGGGGGPYYPGYSNQAYNGHERAEYRGGGAGGGGANGSYSRNGTGNRVGYYGGQPPRGQSGRSVPPPAAVEDDDEEYERGHWGSKAEFILSCVGFSVSEISLFCS